MKKFIVFFQILLLLFGSTSCRKAEENKKVVSEKKKSEAVVSVNGVDYNMERFNLHFYNAQDEILKGAGYTESKDIPEDFWDTNGVGVTMLELAKTSAIDMLIEDALEYEKAREYKITLTADELSGIKNRMSALRQDKVTVAQFEYMGISVKELEEYYKDEMLTPSLVTELIGDGKIVPNPEAVLEEFESSYVKIKQIYVPTIDLITREPYSPENIKASEEKIKAAMERLEFGEEFDDVAMEYTQDYYTTVYPNGYIITFEDWNEDVERVAFGLRDEEVSDLVISEEGFHIIKRMPFDFEDPQELSCLESIEAEFATPELEKLVKQWRKDADVKINEDALSNLKPLITNNSAITVKID